MTGDDEVSPPTDTVPPYASRTLHRVPGDGPDSPTQSTTEAPPPRRARRVTPDPAISATAVADPLLAADAAAAEASNGDASNGDHPADETAPTPVVAPVAKVSTRSPKSSKPTRSSKPRKTAAAKAAAVGVTTAAVETVDLPPTEAVEVVQADGVKTDGVAADVAKADVTKTDSVKADGVKADGAAPATEPSTETAKPQGDPTPSSGVPMVALVPPVTTEPTPTVTAPTAAAVAAATVTLPALVPDPAAPVPLKPVKGPKPSPTPKAKTAARRRVRARRVQRIVRRVDAWSVLKISFVFFIVMYLVLLVAGVLLWAFAVGTGTIDNVENFIEQLFALDSFSFVGAQILRASVIGGALLVVAGTFTTTVLAVLFNLISDLVGGVRFTVVEEQVLRPVHPAARPARTESPSSVDGSTPAPGTV